MPKLFKLIAFCLLFFTAGIFSQTKAQSNDAWVTNIDTAALYKVTRFDGHYFVAKIVSMDEHEILLFIPGRGRLVVPAYEVRSIALIGPSQFSSEGRYIDDGAVFSQYFLNTSAHGIEKGQAQVGGHLLGPDLTVALSDKLSVRLMTTWVAAPIMSTLNYRIPIRNKFNIQFGLMGTWASWFDEESGMVLPFAAATFGDKKKNITFTGGYGFMNYYGEKGPAPYGAVSGIISTGDRWSFLFDSYFTQYQDRAWGWDPFGGRSVSRTETSASFGVGTRYSNGKRTCFQFGVAGVFSYDYVYPFPLLQVFHKIN